MADAAHGGGGGGLTGALTTLFWWVVAIAGIVIIGTLVIRFVQAEFFDRPFSLNTFQGLSTGGGGHGSGTGGSAGAPHRVSATRERNTVCPAHSWQFSWNGRSGWCMVPQPSANSYLIRNPTTGNLAWYTP